MMTRSTSPIIMTQCPSRNDDYGLFGSSSSHRYASRFKALWVQKATTNTVAAQHDPSEFLIGLF